MRDIADSSKLLGADLSAGLDMDKRAEYISSSSSDDGGGGGGGGGGNFGPSPIPSQPYFWPDLFEEQKKERAEAAARDEADTKADAAARSHPVYATVKKMFDERKVPLLADYMLAMDSDDSEKVCLFACLNCLPSTTVCPQLLFALNCLPSTVCPQLRL